MKHLLFLSLIIIMASCVPEPKIYTTSDFGIKPDQEETAKLTTPQPTVLVRFADPVLVNGKLILKAQFKGVDFDSLRLFAINIRFFQDAAIYTNDTRILTARPGYGIMPPNPAIVKTGNAASKIICGFIGASTYFNGAIQLVEPNQPPVYLNDWETIFEIELTPKNIATSCPYPVWEKMLDPNQGGFLGGSDGVVITVLQNGATISSPVIEKAEQLNWTYGSGVKYKYPYGTPVCQ